MLRDFRDILSGKLTLKFFGNLEKLKNLVAAVYIEEERTG